MAESHECLSEKATKNHLSIQMVFFYNGEKRVEVLNLSYVPSRLRFGLESISDSVLRFGFGGSEKFRIFASA